MSSILLSSVNELSNEEIQEIVSLAQGCADIEHAPMLAVRVHSLLGDPHSSIKVVRAQREGGLAGVGLVNVGREQADNGFLYRHFGRKEDAVAKK